MITLRDINIVLDSKSSEEDALKQNIEELLEGYDFGFKRRERLDVKKPGPPFDRLINTESKKGKRFSLGFFSHRPPESHLPYKMYLLFHSCGF